jgi:hypothetical protein
VRATPSGPESSSEADKEVSGNRLQVSGFPDG